MDAQNAPTAPWKTLCVFHELPQGLSNQITHEKPRKAPKWRWETRIDPEATQRPADRRRRDRRAPRPRTRGCLGYNRFRELLHLPRFDSFDALTEDKGWAKELSDVYGGDIDKVDALVGMLAEKPPEGFGFSDTAFRVFLLMASRRLQSDRFLTHDYRPEIYTQLGIAWVENTTMTDVILRHFPELETRLRSDANAFKPWDDPENILTFRD